MQHYSAHQNETMTDPNELRYESMGSVWRCRCPLCHKYSNLALWVFCSSDGKENRNDNVDVNLETQSLMCFFAVLTE